RPAAGGRVGEEVREAPEEPDGDDGDRGRGDPDGRRAGGATAEARVRAHAEVPGRRLQHAGVEGWPMQKARHRTPLREGPNEVQRREPREGDARAVPWRPR